MNFVQRITNVFFPSIGDPRATDPSKGGGVGGIYEKDPALVGYDKRNLKHVISPVQFDRLKTDVSMWREAVKEAEPGFQMLRQRVRMQRMYYDTVLNAHVLCCIVKRKAMVLKKQFVIVDEEDNVDENATAYFRAPWFRDYISYVLDAPLFGYQLLTLGDVVNDRFPDLSFIPRENVSPDRRNVTTFIYSQTGTSFDDDPQRLWHIYVKTPSENGKSPCGYGLLYVVSMLEIFLRNNMVFNVDFNEMYGQPMRVGKTNKNDQSERDTFFDSLVNLAHKGAILLDENTGDTIELVESKNAGTGWQGFENLEQRLEAKITKVLLGHEDAMKSTPGKLGSGQNDGKKSQVEEALDETESVQTMLAENTTNEELIPRMQEMGFNIPLGCKGKFLNNKEKQEIRDEQNRQNAIEADIALKMFQAGLKYDPVQFEERTGIKTSEVVAAVAGGPLPQSIKSKLQQIYK